MKNISYKNLRIGFIFYLKEVVVNKIIKRYSVRQI